MPNDTAGKNAAMSPDNDDDIVDLLEVVKPGKSAPRAGGDDEDFEAMLNRLSSETTDASAERPFLDPTPVGYAVDHNEQLELPDMTDVDALLETLGETPTAPPVKDRSAAGLAADTRDKGLAENAQVEDLDAMPLGGTDGLPEAVEIDDDFLAELGAGPKTGGSGPAAAQSDLADLDDLLADMDTKLDGAAPAKTAEPQAELADLDDLLADMDPAPAIKPPARKAAPPAPEPAAATGTSSGSRDEVDLNELDALLDDVLAGAPDTAGADNSGADLDAVLDEALESGGSGVSQSAIDDLRQGLRQLDSQLKDALDATRKGMQKDLVAALGRATEAESATTTLRGQLSTQGASLESQAAKLAESAKTLEAISAAVLAAQEELKSQAAALKATQAEQQAQAAALTATQTEQRTQAAALTATQTEQRTQAAALTATQAEQQAQAAALQSLRERASAPASAPKEAVEGMQAMEERLQDCLAQLEQAQSLLNDEQSTIASINSAVQAGNARLDKLEQDQADLGNRFQEVAQTIVGQTATVKGLEASLETHGATLETLGLARAEDSERLSRLSQLDYGDSLREINERLPLLQSRLDGAEQSLVEQIGRLKKVENAANTHWTQAANTDVQLGQVSKTLEGMTKTQEAIRGRLDALERRLSEMESGMEKAAAAAAATVIRQEIAALLSGEE